MQEVSAFIGNVDTAFSVINPNKEDVLYRFVLTRISGEPRIAISHRHHNSWAELQEFLKNSYIEKRTLDYHASQLFKARQGKEKRVSDWIQNIQTLGSQCDGAREGILDLSDRLRNICFIQGLTSDRIQIIVRSRNYRNFDEIAETALVEESAIASRQDWYRTEGNAPLKCGFCGKTGHLSNTCYARGKEEVRVNHVVTSGTDYSKSTTCFRCGERGHIARNCQKPPRKREGNDRRRPSGSSRTTVSSIQ